MNQLKRIPPAIALGTVLVFGSGLAMADDDEIYTCRDENGVPSFQNDPCPELSEKTIAISAPVAVPVSRKTAPQAKPAPRMRTSSLVVKFPTPTAPKPQRPVASWSRVPPAEHPPPISTRNLGKQTFSTRLNGASATPSFVSPEQTWNTFLAAVEIGDPGRAAACLTPAARETLGPLDDLRRMLNTFTRIEDGGDVGPFWTIRGVREKQQPKWILFEETPTGEWKIAGI
jgi:hypothetical protein